MIHHVWHRGHGHRGTYGEGIQTRTVASVMDREGPKTVVVEGGSGRGSSFVARGVHCHNPPPRRSVLGSDGPALVPMAHAARPMQALPPPVAPIRVLGGQTYRFAAPATYAAVSLPHLVNFQPVYLAPRPPRPMAFGGAPQAPWAQPEGWLGRCGWALITMFAGIVLWLTWLVSTSVPNRR